MGRVKAMLPLDGGDTFLTRIVRTFSAAGVEEIVVVLGYEAESIRQSLEQSALPVRTVLNPRYREGQLQSVIAALDVVDRPGVEAMLLTLVDVPLVSPSTVSAVLARYRESRAPIVRPVQGERHGHPVVMDRSLFAEIRSADPSAGAKPVVRAHVSQAGDVEVFDEGAFLDVDTPEEYARLLGGRRDR